MLECSLPQATEGLKDLEAFFQAIQPETVPYMLCESILKGMNEMVKNIMERYRRGGDSHDWDFVAADLSCCNKGFHRSLLRASIGYLFSKELGFSAGLRQHHTQRIPGFQPRRDKEACGCGTRSGCRIARNGRENYGLWEETNRRARADVYLVLRRVLLEMLPRFPLLRNSAIPFGPASQFPGSWLLQPNLPKYVEFMDIVTPARTHGDEHAKEVNEHRAENFPQMHGRSRGEHSPAAPRGWFCPELPVTPAHPVMEVDSVDAVLASSAVTVPSTLRDEPMSGGPQHDIGAVCLGRKCSIQITA